MNAIRPDISLAREKDLPKPIIDDACDRLVRATSEAEG